MVAPQVVPDFDTVHTSCPAHQSKEATIIRNRTDHLKNFDIEALKKLLDAGFVGANLRSTLGSTDSVHLYGRLKGAT